MYLLLARFVSRFASINIVSTLKLAVLGIFRKSFFLLLFLATKKAAGALIDLFVDAKHLLNPLQSSAATVSHTSPPRSADHAA